MTLDELQSTLDRVAEYFPGGAVIIRGDEATAHGVIMEVLNSCGKADIHNIGFAALPEEAQGAQ